MSGRFTSAITLPLLVLVTAAGAQTDTRLALHYADGTFSGAPVSPIKGSVNRTAIPNEYLEVSVARGTIHIEGGASDKVEWSLVARDWNIYTRPDTGGAHRPIVAAENPGVVGTATWRDRFTVDLKLNPAARPSLHPDVQLSVPHDLKILHVIVHGEGDVIVESFSGELTIEADSGTIVGSKLTGPVLLESRNGGITLDLAQSPFQVGPVNLLAHSGPIDLLLPPHPSVTLDLNANCGVIDYGGIEPESMRRAGAPVSSGAAAQELDCSLRPKSLPALPGVLHLHNNANFSVGDGALRIRGMALQGDINLRTKADPKPVTQTSHAAADTCAGFPDAGTRPDGSPMLSTIIGRVLDSDGRSPLQGAHLQIVGTQFGVFTDKNGEYRLAFDSRTFEKCVVQYVRVAAPGHTDELFKLKVTGNGLHSADVTLRKH